jgi:hypothetical protein
LLEQLAVVVDGTSLGAQSSFMPDWAWDAGLLKAPEAVKSSNDGENMMR